MTEEQAVRFCTGCGKPYPPDHLSKKGKLCPDCVFKRMKEGGRRGGQSPKTNRKDDD